MRPMTWFEKLTGFEEHTPEQVRDRLRLEEGVRLRSQANGRSWHYGRLEIPSLGMLRRQVLRKPLPKGNLKITETVANVQDLYANPANTGALFQVASQFNLLEMISPEVTPEMGVGRYERDRTQGPACAIACGAGTIYRNYFVEIDGQTGQSAERQIDCLEDLGKALGNDQGELWRMRNGYCLASRPGLMRIADRLKAMNAEERERLKERVKIGIQWESEVTLPGGGHRVSQAYCSALPVGYSRHPAELWEPFARLILEAAYEATLLAGIVNYAETGNPKVYLTMLGGGAFGNETEWIIEAMHQVFERFRETPLEVEVVSHKRRNPALRNLL